MTSLKDIVLGDVQIIPVFRVHRLVKTLASTEMDYAKLTHAVWASIHGSGWGSTTLYGNLQESEAAEVAKTILDVREMLGTALAKHKSVVMMASPKTAVSLLKLGYRLRLGTVDSHGVVIPRSQAATGYIQGLYPAPGDPLTSWRIFTPIFDKFKNREFVLKDLPTWVASCAENT